MFIAASRPVRGSYLLARYVIPLICLLFSAGAAPMGDQASVSGPHGVEARPWLDLSGSAPSPDLADPSARDAVAHDCASGKAARPRDCDQLDAWRRRAAAPGAPDRPTPMTWGTQTPWPSDTGFPPAGGPGPGMPMPCNSSQRACPP